MEGRMAVRRIGRTIMPSVAETATQSFNSKNFNYFYKIPAKAKLLDQRKQEDSIMLTRLKPKTTLSLPFSMPRTRLSIQSKSERKIDPSTTRTNSLGITARTGRSSSSRAESMKRRDPVQEEFELEMLNINKTISGTHLGALSGNDYLRDMEQAKARQSMFKGFALTKRMSDVEGVEESIQLLDHVVKPVGIHPKRRQANKKQPKQVPLQKLIQTIYAGDEEMDFIDKCKDSQRLLMERNSYYKSKELTLDYKNDWRI